MSFLISKTDHHLLILALTGTLTDAGCTDLVARAAPSVRFLAAAACAWNQSASASAATVAAWTVAYPAGPKVWAAVQNRTAFPQCRRGLGFTDVHDRLHDFAFRETNDRSVAECFLRRTRPAFAAADLERSGLARLLMATSL